MAISAAKGEGGLFWEINITPLTDIFLVLLIIFMVTASVAVESATHVNLPAAENTSPENKGVLVTYTANHELFVNSKDVPERDIESELHDALLRVDSKVVIFQGDRTVLLGDMVRILDLAKAAGAEQIAIAARRAAPGERTRQADTR
jgi:biopolymer transport protein ExbD